VIEGIDKPSLGQRIAYLGGPTGLYRGILPGSVSVFLRNGTASIVMGVCQSKAKRAWTAVTVDMPLFGIEVQRDARRC